MARSTAASATLNDEFEYPAQLSILRRAVGELSVLSEDAANVAACAAELTRFRRMAEALVSAFAQSVLCRNRDWLRRAASAALLALYGVGERLEHPPARGVSRAQLEGIRRNLYAVLATLSERVAPFDGINEAAALSLTELDRALAMRLIVSDFYGTMLTTSQGRANKGWSLTVAEAELAIVMRRPAFAQGPEPQQRRLADMFARIAGFRAGTLGVPNRAHLRAELLASSELLAALSQRVDVRRHDERSLAALGALLSGRKLDLGVVANAAEILAGLRGMDPELDRLMLELPFEPVLALKHIAHRVGGLRQRLLAS